MTSNRAVSISCHHCSHSWRCIAATTAQAALQRANVDFKPLIEHFSALEYATKYATKQETSR